MTEKIGEPLGTLPRSFFPKVTGSKFLDSHFIQGSQKDLKLCLSGRLTPPHSPGEGLQVTNFDLCLHIVMVPGKCTDVFREIFWGLGERVEGRYFHRGTSQGNRISMKEAQDFLALFEKQ